MFYFLVSSILSISNKRILEDNFACWQESEMKSQKRPGINGISKKGLKKASRTQIKIFWQDACSKSCQEQLWLEQTQHNTQDYNDPQLLTKDWYLFSLASDFQLKMYHNGTVPLCSFKHWGNKVRKLSLLYSGHCSPKSVSLKKSRLERGQLKN